MEITDEDKNGFMMAVHKLDRTKGLDLFLHTPGGSISSTQSIVDYLHKMFGKNIRAIVPQIAMSAGTMIARQDEQDWQDGFHGLWFPPCPLGAVCAGIKGR
jgi:ClpP class serine protease